MSIHKDDVHGFKTIDRHSPSFITPLFSYVILKKIVNLAQPGLFDAYEYFLGRVYAQRLCTLYTQAGTTGMRMVNKVLDEFKEKGFGTTKIVLLNKQNILIKNINSSIAKQYSKSFHEDKKCADYYLAGIYSGVLSAYFKEEISISEEKCVCKNSPECVFTLGKKVDDKYQLQKEVEEVCKEKNLALPNDQYPHFFTTRMFQRGTYQNSEGVIKIANILHVFFPFNFVTISNHILSKKKKEISELHRYLGYVQGCVARKFQENMMGRKDADAVFSELIKHFNMDGFGIGNIVSKKEKEIVVEFTKNAVLKQTSKLMNVFRDPYHEGGIAGFAAAYPKKVSEVSFEQIGEDKLRVIITFEGENEYIHLLEKHVHSKEMLDLIQERVHHKYYLSPS